MKSDKKPYRRKHNIGRIKQGVAYEYHEVATLLGVSKGTVRNWVKQGLPVMRSQRPHLIKGLELKAFLRARQSKVKNPCKIDELYCFKCRHPRRAWEGAIDVKAINEKKLLLKGICEICERNLSKIQPMRNVSLIAETFRVQQWHNASILARIYPHLNYHLEKESKT